MRFSEPILPSFLTCPQNNPYFYTTHEQIKMGDAVFGIPQCFEQFIGIYDATLTPKRQI
jgi:hypothetical protein